ncbi:MAG: response regulator [Gemmatimonadales bacterium]|nr:response regulator [Gemmatimonadales bacterium]
MAKTSEASPGPKTLQPEANAGAKTGRPPLVLIGNDQEWSSRSLESILAPEGYAVLRAYTGRQTLERARTAQPDLIIIEAQLPDISGVEVCRALRDDPRFCATIPIIITTAGPSGRAQRLEAHRAGAWEFLGQPLDGDSLLLKLHTFLQAKKAVDVCQDQSLLDHETGLYNMRGLAHRAREIGSEAYRRRHPLACVVFSPQPVCPEGHPEAEEYAKLVAEVTGDVIRRSGRTSDAIGRVGPGEFAVIAPATDIDGVLRLVDRLGNAIESIHLPTEDVTEVGLRAGYSAVPDFSTAALDPVELLLRATTALRRLLAEAELNQGGRLVRAFEGPEH